MKKSILFKIWKFPQLSETFIVNQIALAITMGYEVKVLVGEITDATTNASNLLFEKYDLKNKIIIEDYEIPQQKLKRILKAAWLLFNNILLVPHLIKYHNATNKKGIVTLYEFFFYKNFRAYDTIHIQFGTNKHPVDILKNTGFLKSKIIVSFHGHDLCFPINSQIPNNGYYNRLFASSNYLVANTPYLKDKLIALDAPKDKTVIIPVAVDTSKFKLSVNRTPEKKIRLITVGRLDELKGQQYGIMAVKLLIQKGFNIEYVIVGSGEGEKELKNLIEKLELTTNVFLKGKSTPDEIPQLLQNSHIFLMTSITNSIGMQESQGLVTAEAQACGLPVVAFDTGGIKYTIIEGETGYLCKEMDVESYADRIELLISNKVLRSQMGLNARKFIEEKYSVKSVLNKWKNLYD